MAEKKKQAPVKKESAKITVCRNGMDYKIDKKNLDNFLAAGWKKK